MTTLTGAAYELIDGWEQLPAGYRHADVAGVAVDASDRVYLLTRREARVLVYERDGRFVRSWGEDRFTDHPHGITVGPDGTVYCVDDADHTIQAFSADGSLLLTLGTSGMPSETGYDGKSLASVSRGGPPFNRPTNVAVAPSGDLYVSDGYGNSRVHHFRSDGTLVRSWGSPGSGPGEFMLPHGIGVLADGRVLVADRENDRVQVFGAEGAYLDQWTNVQRPTHLVQGPDGLVYVSELWWRPGQRSFVHGPVETDRYGGVSVLDPNGALRARWGGGPPGTPGNFTAPHGIAVDSRGDVYVAEVTDTFGVRTGAVPPGFPTLQKFARR